MSLVADYGDSSASDEESMKSDTESSTSSESFIEESTPLAPPTEKLPMPGFIDDTHRTNQLGTSVFKNPFKLAETEKQAILEKHVKMVETQENVKIINGKKICWNYRKGRCRFGHNCVYAHDSDVQKTKEQLEAEQQAQQTILCDTHPLKDEQNKNGKEGKRKRPGLTQGLVPGKKVMKAYHDHVKSVFTSVNK